jgi:hypothetical protein
MDGVQPQTLSVPMECILDSHIHNVERPCMAKLGETQTRRWVCDHAQENTVLPPKSIHFGH